VVFIKKRLNLAEILPFVAALDYVVLEGFESEKAVPKIVAAKTADEAESYFDDSAIAISGIISDSEVELKKASGLRIPVLKASSQSKELADLVEKKALKK
jgi:molybdopterin-guanine dinucleotide biosynthesis protein